jgi:putrescine aminotransferase
MVTFAEALHRSAGDSFRAFARHVNPDCAALLRIGGFDRNYVRAEGASLYDEHGRSYLDFTAGFGALNLGHNPPEVIEAVASARALPSVLLVGYSPLAASLAETLAELLPGELSMTCFGCGGAEAVEFGLKTARAASGRVRLVSCTHAYHGLSFGAMSVAGDRRYRALFGPLVEHCESVPFGDVAALDQRLANDDVAAFIVEPVQGEGGAVEPPTGYLKAVQEICHAHGTLLIVDEIQTGFGRTGRMFAIDEEGAVPDIVLLSKSLAAGVVPISVCVTTEEIWRRAYGGHERFDLVITTFGGNSVACAAGLKAIEILRRDHLPERAEALGRHARSRLEALARKHDSVTAIHGKGLLLGIELRPPAGGAALAENFPAMIGSCLLNDHGVLTGYFDLAPNTLRFEPPLIVTQEQIDHAVDAFDDVLGRGVGSLAMSVGKQAVGRFLHS